MDIFSFSQIFSGQTQTQTRDNSDHGPVYTAVPKAPVYDEIPEIDFFLKGSGDGSYKHGIVEPALPSQTQWKGTPVRKKISFRNKTLSDDEDTIYLGSQYPLVHRVRSSQAERLQKRGDLEVFVNPAPVQPYDKTAPPSGTGDNRREPENPQRSGTNEHEQWITANVKPRVVEKRPKDLVKTPAAIISELYRKIFSFPYFNIVQSKVFDDVMYTDRPLVLCSPTGSGKTAVFEMAIVRLLQQSLAGSGHCMKVVYMAPIKALCSEKYNDWKAKFEPFGLKVMELTGDTDTEDFYELQEVNIILTTPEKWDSMTRKWRDNRAVMEAICLFLIDEIHVLNDATRGATVEAVLSRMKTIQAARGRAKSAGPAASSPGLRFLAVSATITNIEDLAEWLGSNKDNPALFYKFDDSVRPVRLRKVVLGFYFAEGKQSEFQFDLTLSYKMSGIINTYAENKPSLVFCATRKGAIQGAEILAKDGRHSYIRNGEHRKMLQNISFHVKDAKLRDLVAKGIGYHHAGMDLQDRKSIEQIFASGDLPVLVATSTLAMGVNLPAHLVIIKSTMYYHMGVHQEYSDTQVLQMIGRAGRPQFDSSATAVIMTKNQTKMKYENLINGTQLLESSLHKNLIEHLNAEIVLHTITDMSVALEWLKYTFLYIRVMKNPQQYGLQNGLSRNMIEKKLQEMCMQCLNRLHGLNLIHMDQETLDVKPTENGRLMARYCISYRTAELFHSIGGTESVAELLTLMSKCEEFEDILLRTSEKKALNTLNKDKNRLTIRYPMTGKIKTTDMKVNCLIQAQFGCLLVQDFALQQDTSRIFRAGMRITRCLVEFLSQKNEYKSLLSALQLCKCFKAKLWEDSKYVSRQLEGIGPTLSTAMVNASLTTFEKIEQTNPREIELIVNRHPPFGNQVRNSVAKLPKYEIVIEQSSRYNVRMAEIVVTVQLANKQDLQDMVDTTNHTCTLLIGDEDNHVVYKQRIMDKLLMKDITWCKRLEIKQANKGPELHVHYISQDIAGLDVDCTYTPNYLGGMRITSSSVTPKAPVSVMPEKPAVSQVGRPCQHTCHNKNLCAHECCKTGVASKRRPSKTPQLPAPQLPAQVGATRSVSSHLSELKNKSAGLPNVPSLSKRLRMNHNKPPVIDLTRFAYTTNKTQAPVAHNMLLPDCHAKPFESPNFAAAPCSKQRPLTSKPKKLDWTELDMYQKCRENYQAEVSTRYLDEDSLPDIDQEAQPYLHLGPGLQAVNVPQEMWEDDFAQETDYGYTYVHGQDKEEIPADWDDKLVGQLNDHRGVKRSAGSDSTAGGWNTVPKSAQYKSVRGNFKRPASDQDQNKMVLPAYQSYLSHMEDDYDIQDFSDEEDQRAENQDESVSSVANMATRNHDFCPTKNTASKKFLFKRETFGTEMGGHDANCLNNKNLQFFNGSNASYDMYAPITNELIFDSNEEYEAVVCDSAMNDGYKKGDQGRVEGDNEEDGVDNSKWDNYCNTQETSVSDSLNWQYPAKVGKEVVMENRRNMVTNRGHVEGKNDTQLDCHSDVTKAGQTQSIGAVGNLNPSLLEQDHKYGQVLAWVSDNENQASGTDRSPEWEPWGSQDELLARAECVVGAKSDQKLDTWACKDTDAPMKDINKAKPVEVKKPRFTSFFSTEEVDAPMEGFYNIFDGIF